MTTLGAPLAGLTNWAGNHAYGAAQLYEPESIEELQEIVRGSRSLRVLGSRHSFNDIADSTGDLVSLRRMPRVFELDRWAMTVKVDGGVRYGELCVPLNAAGFALHNLASLPHISVAGFVCNGYPWFGQSERQPGHGGRGDGGGEGGRGSNRRRRRPVDEHGLRSSVGCPPLHLAARLGDVRKILPSIEAALAPFEPRPHWGKVFTMSPEAIRASYERLPPFVELLRRYDPSGVFRNRFLDQYISGAE